ncbi:hypothetical protein O3S80_02455 [Streptomyces sp. Lzd4kr]|nr:hypothetical protein [Streptomyces sp. Lzd4kr]
MDDLIRVIRNLAGLALIASAASALVAYAGVRMGVSPEICWVGSVGSGPMLVRAFVKLFETVRPALPDAPKDQPSNGEQPQATAPTTNPRLLTGPSVPSTTEQASPTGSHPRAKQRHQQPKRGLR